MDDITQLASKFIEDATDEIYCTLPCQVEAINGNYVDVKVFINEEEPDQILYNVPIQRPETQRAYIFLGIKKGDRGVLKFFDRSTEGYLQSDFDYNSDERQHDINDRVFSLGFIPDSESYVYPADKEIEIGLKNQKFKLSVDENGNLDITSTTKITLNAPNINTIGLLTHTGNISVIGDVTVSNNITSTNGIISGTINAKGGKTGTYDKVKTTNGIVTDDGSTSSS